MDTSNDFESVK
jgi:UDP-N-acetylglucosamine/UDP-N-acetylgalactosamine diphosphorylase